MDTKKLRQKILDLAIRGKLVAQDPNDEPASVLLERIKSTQITQITQITQMKQMNTDKKISEIQSNQCDYPFEVPENWVWYQVKMIGEVITGSTPPKEQTEYYGDDYPFYKPTDLEQGVSVVKAMDNLSSLGYAKARQLPPFSILVTCIGATIGKTGLIRCEGSCNQQINAIIPNGCVVNDYFLFYSCLSDYFQNQILDNASATTLPIINKSKFEQLFIPLPPLSEQHRIVSVIETAFALIDEIEANKQSLTQYIKQTKSKVLDLAICGKLVPQDPNDEPASVLLEHIRSTQKTQMNTDKKISENQSNQCHQCAYPFEIPESWEWCKLGDVGNWSAGTTPNRSNCKYYENGTVPWLKTGDLNDSIILNVSEYINEYALRECKQLKMNLIGSVAIALYGATIGKCGILGLETTTNQACCVCKTYSIIFNKYLFYFLISHREQFKDKAEGGAQPNISKDKIVNSFFPLPPLSEQHRIVSQIEQIFTQLDAIQNNLI